MDVTEEPRLSELSRDGGKAIAIGWHGDGAHRVEYAIEGGRAGRPSAVSRRSWRTAHRQKEETAARLRLRVAAELFDDHRVHDAAHSQSRRGLCRSAARADWSRRPRRWCRPRLGWASLRLCGCELPALPPRPHPQVRDHDRQDTGRLRSRGRPLPRLRPRPVRDRHIVRRHRRPGRPPGLRRRRRGDLTRLGTAASTHGFGARRDLHGHRLPPGHRHPRPARGPTACAGPADERRPSRRACRAPVPDRGSAAPARPRAPGR